MPKGTKPWTKSEDEILLNSDAPRKEIAKVLGRSVDACNTRHSILVRELNYLSLEEQKHIKERCIREKKESLARKDIIAELTKDNQYSNEQKTYLEKLYKQGLDISYLLNSKYTLLQMKQIAMGLNAGIKIEYYSNPEYNDRQMAEIRVGLTKGLDTSWYRNPMFSCEAMRQIRLGIEAGLPVQYYANPLYDGVQMEQFRLALQDHLPVWEIMNPAYNREQLKVLRLALSAGVDITTFKNPNLTAEEMKKRYQALYEKFRNVYETKNEKIEKLDDSLLDLHEKQEPFVIHARHESEAYELLNTLSSLQYTQDLRRKSSSGKLSGVYFTCNPVEKTVISDQNKPKNGNYITYSALRQEEEPKQTGPKTEDWISCSEQYPKTFGYYQVVIREPDTGRLAERLVEFRNKKDSPPAFDVDGTVLAWKPHFKT